MIAPRPVDRVLAKLKDVKPAGDGKWMALCPGHDDRARSLSVKVGADQRAVLYCHAQCATNAIVGALGLTMADLFAGDRPTSAPVDGLSTAKALGVEQRERMVKSYDYHDQHGALLFQACRYEPKTFRQRRPDGKGNWAWGLGDVSPVPYRLPELIEAAAHGHTIYVVEGEKDADALAALGYAATTSPMGAGKWRDEYGEYFADSSVVVIPDNDDVGRKHMQDVAASITQRNGTVKVLTLPNLPDKADLSDWLAAGGSAVQLDRLAADAPTWGGGEILPAPAALRFKLLSIRELEELPPMEWLVGEELAGVLPAESLIGIFGAPSSGKSFIAADLACTVASRPDRVPAWFGNEVRRGPVVYVAAEGGRGFRHRVLAWRTHHGIAIDELHLSFVLEPVNLFGPDDVSHILRAVDALPERPALIVFDTVARSMVGGDENSAQDMGMVIDRADRVKRETGATVTLVHHARKDGDVERGSGALRAGVDTLCLVREDEDAGRILSCEKQKDADPFEPITFYLQPVGESCVVSARAPEGERALTTNQRAALKVLGEVFAKGATSAEWKSASGLADRTFYRVRAWLVAHHYASEWERGSSTRYAIDPRGTYALQGLVR